MTAKQIYIGPGMVAEGRAAEMYESHFRLPLNLLPDSLPDQSKLDDYNPFPEVGYHVYRLTEIGKVDTWRVMRELFSHYGGGSHLDYIAMTRETLFKCFDADLPIYRVTDANMVYPPSGRKLSHCSDDVYANVYSNRGKHIRPSKHIQEDEIVVVLRRPKHPMIQHEVFDAARSFPISAKISTILDNLRHIKQIEKGQPQAVSFSVSSLTEGFASNGIQVEAKESYLLSELTLENTSLGVVQPDALSVGYVEPSSDVIENAVRLASIEISPSQVEQVNEVFANLMAEGKQLAIQGLHYDGEKLHITYVTE